MRQVDIVIKYLNGDSNLEWINDDSVSKDNWKAKIFGHKVTKRQIGIYKRETTLFVRLEKYDTEISGVIIYPKKMPTSYALDEVSFSRFKDGKGVCIRSL